MKDTTLTIAQLLEHPKVKELIIPEQIEKIAASLGKSKQASKDPLYIRILFGLGAWFAAVFIIIFIGISQMFVGGFSAIICGIFSVAAAILIARASRATFLDQFSLALSFAGNALILLGVSGELRSFDIEIILITHAVVCTVVYLLYASSIYRFIAPIALAVIATVWVIEREIFFLMHFLIAAEMLLAGVLLLHRECPPILRPLVYSATVMLPATLLFMNLMQVNIWRNKFNEPLWPSGILLASGLIYLYYHLAGDTKRLREPWAICAIVSTILLGIFSTPGILVAIGLLVIGYAFGDIILTALSYLFLPFFLVVFYYAMNIDLAHKSWIIAGSGVLLLIVRWVVGHLQPEEEVT